MRTALQPFESLASDSPFIVDNFISDQPSGCNRKVAHKIVDNFVARVLIGE
jgi:hypothetical protein